jgi:glutaredoxin 3
MSGLPSQPEDGPTPGGLQAKVEIYTTRHCGYCVRAKQLLQARGVAFMEHAIDGDGEARRQMVERAGGRRTIPQIFIDDRAIGGFMELYQLDRDGQLDTLLRRAAPMRGTPDGEAHS